MAAKKSFKDNPALQFLSAAEETPSAAYSGAKAPEGYKLNPMYVETRSRRLQLVLQPSLYDKVREKAAEEGISVNEYIHRVLAAAVEE